MKVKQLMPYIPPHIQKLKPYQSARDLYQGDYLFLDANENCFGPLVSVGDLEDIDLSAYPDTDATRLRKALADRYDLNPGEIAIFNGSDEAIPDILLTFSEPGDKVAGLDIGFGMYRSFCQIHGREYIEISTNEDGKVGSNDVEDRSGIIKGASANVIRAISNLLGITEDEAPNLHRASMALDILDADRN